MNHMTFFKVFYFCFLKKWQKSFVVFQCFFSTDLATHHEMCEKKTLKPLKSIKSERDMWSQAVTLYFMVSDKRNISYFSCFL